MTLKKQTFLLFTFLATHTYLHSADKDIKLEQILHGLPAEVQYELELTLIELKRDHETNTTGKPKFNNNKPNGIYSGVAASTPHQCFDPYKTIADLAAAKRKELGIPETSLPLSAQDLKQALKQALRNAKVKNGRS